MHLFPSYTHQAQPHKNGYGLYEFCFISISGILKQMLEEHRVCEMTSRSAAGTSLTFIVLVTPWAIQQVITSCTGTDVSPNLSQNAFIIYHRQKLMNIF